MCLIRIPERSQSNLNERSRASAFTLIPATAKRSRLTVILSTVRNLVLEI